MLSINEQLKKSVHRIEQLKNQKKSQERQEQAVKRKMDTRRKIIIGGLVCKYFPDIMKYQPQRSNADTTEEFAAFENILRILVVNVDLLTELKAEAAKLT